MPAKLDSWRFLVADTTDPSGFGGATWTDRKADLIGGLVIKLGTRDYSPIGRTSQPGSLHCALDNHSTNAAGLQGYYSPGHANALANFDEGTGIQVEVTWNSVAYTIFYGRIKHKGIKVITGKHRERITNVVCHDYVGELQKALLPRLTVKTGQRADQNIKDIVDAMTVSPFGSATYDPDTEVMAYALDFAEDEKHNALDEIAALCMSSMGYFFVRADGSLHYQNRLARLEDTTVQYTLAETMREMPPVGRGAQYYERFIVRGYPRSVGTASEVLARENNIELALAPGESRERELRYIDPDNPDIRVSASVVDDLISGTDYQFSDTRDGGGQRNADLTITHTKGANSSKFVLQNDGTLPGWVTLLQVQGTIVRHYDPVDYIEEVTTLTGGQEIVYDAPYQDRINVLEGMAQELKRRYGTKKNDLVPITFRANRSSAHMDFAFKDGLLGKRFAFTETISGASAENAFIAGKEFHLNMGGGNANVPDVDMVIHPAYDHDLDVALWDTDKWDEAKWVV